MQQILKFNQLGHRLLTHKENPRFYVTICVFKLTVVTGEIPKSNYYKN